MKERVKLLEDFLVVDMVKQDEYKVLKKGTVLNSITDKYGCVQLILPRKFRNTNFGYPCKYEANISTVAQEKLLGRRITKYIGKIRVDYLLLADLNITFKYIK